MTEVPKTRVYTVVTDCACGGKLQLRTARVGGYFLGCTNYPKCKATMAYDSVVAELAESLSKLTDILEAKGRPREKRQLPLGWRVLKGGKQ